jgi:hypothetical protein
MSISEDHHHHPVSRENQISHQSSWLEGRPNGQQWRELAIDWKARVVGTHVLFVWHRVPYSVCGFVSASCFSDTGSNSVWAPRGTSNIKRTSRKHVSYYQHWIFQWRFYLGTQVLCSPSQGHMYQSIREISSSHGGEYDVQSCLLGYTAV